ncbi:type II toxin-antitoxin system VapB family antitoxin [Nocardioides limicola]|uniref:type II toxin-antitoxin system VapB family antitoxin n=1 Tax=Nocardioides limicola TaxID=2803368 RepID=UPI00193BAE24|nr:type II toxin-antitoxin system VapB family antitoxin [Nocardioides sp. DJM-14]
MGLNIKNEHVHQLARLAAQRTGTTQTGAIEAALEQYLAGLDEPQQRSARRARVDLILADVDARLGDGPGLSTDELYDDAGLPA